MKTINGAMFDGVVRVSTRARGRARCDGDDEGDARAMDLKFGFQKRGARIRIARRLGTSSRARTTGEAMGGVFTRRAAARDAREKGRAR